MNTRRRYLAWFLCLSGVVLMSGVSILSPTVVHARDGGPLCTTPVNLSNTAGLNEYVPQINNGIVVWQGYDGNDREIFMMDLNTRIGPVNLSQNDEQNEWDPQIDDGYVVWYSYTGDDYEVFAVNLNSGSFAPVNISNNGAVDDIRSQVDNGIVVWDGYDGSDYEIFMIDLKDENPIRTQITNNDKDDVDPQIDNSIVVWRGYDGSDYETYMYDINGASGIPIRVTYNSYTDSGQVVDGHHIMWTGWDGNDNEIYLLDLNDGTGTPVPITNNNDHDYAVSLDAGMAVWSRYDISENQTDIYRRNVSNTGSSNFNLSNRGADDIEPTIDADMVVWHSEVGGDSEILLRDIRSGMAGPMNISQRDGVDDDDPVIHDGIVVWRGMVGEHWDIFASICGIAIAEDFEKSNAQLKAQWTFGGTPSKDRIKCNTNTKTVAFEDNCAFQFKGSATENMSITRVSNSDVIKLAGMADAINLGFYVNAPQETAKLKVKLILYYEDGTREKLPLTAGQTPGWRYMGGSINTYKSLNKLKLRFLHRSKSGRVWLDNVEVSVIEVIPISLETIPLPVPDAPEEFRR